MPVVFENFCFLEKIALPETFFDQFRENRFEFEFRKNSKSMFYYKELTKNGALNKVREINNSCLLLTDGNPSELFEN